MNEQNAVREDFRLYLISVMGLSEGSATSYDAYVSGVEKLLGKTADAIVASDKEMQAAITQLRKHNPKNTASNYMSGLRAYYRFKNGKEFGSKDARKRDNDIPFEVRWRMTDLKYRCYESENRLWQQLFQLGVAILLIMPTLVLSRTKDMPLISVQLFVCALSSGIIGLFFAFILLRRPARHAREIKEHECKFALGEETCLESEIVQTTPFELICQWVSSLFFAGMILLLLWSLICFVSDWGRLFGDCAMSHDVNMAIVPTWWG